ncbi:hypothetical protein SELMODRAFT_440300 [Selaginella moellendorffii]|uniref:Uncharacterized protein RPD1L5-1 n=1 Tax=Selaginella moellendorffii TaxID=88036 RepID=D8RAU7_SELML|nr:hypothetical protein SELMODRAFT_440300 [Selaginella moellendorffii]
MVVLDSPLRWLTEAVKRRSLQLATGYFHPEERRWIDQAPKPKQSKSGRSLWKWMRLREIQVWMRDGDLESIRRNDRRIAYIKRVMEYLVSHEQKGSVNLRKLHAVEGLDDNTKHGLRRNAWNYPGFFIVTVNNRQKEDLVALTDKAKQLMEDERRARWDRDESSCVKILKKILMMSRDRRIRRSKLHCLQEYYAFPYDYNTGFLERHPDHIRLVETPKDSYVELVSWDQELAVTEREKAVAQGRTPKELGQWAFVISYPEGYTPNRVRLEQLDNFQRLPFPSPYEFSQRAFDTPVGQKEALGIFHELLSFTVEKRALVSDFTTLAGSLNIPRYFSDSLLSCHPGIFYVSKWKNQHYVFLREAYRGKNLVAEEVDPLVTIRRRYLELMKPKPEKLHLSSRDEDYLYVPISKRGITSNQDEANVLGMSHGFFSSKPSSHRLPNIVR